MAKQQHRARTWKYQVPKRGSTAVETLEVAWAMLREIDRRIPGAVLTLVDLRSRRQVLGYFAVSTWRKNKGAAHEIAISPTLIGHPKDLLATMLHEAAHAILYDQGKNAGVGSTPYYHTKVFRDQCIEFGLTCEFRNSRYGWTLTAWPESGAIPTRWKPVIVCLSKELPAGIGGRKLIRAKGRPLPVPGHTMLVCNCEEDKRTIYVKKSVLEAGGVLCSFCGSEFLPPPPNRFDG